MRHNILKLVTVLLLSLAGTEVSASGVPGNAESKTGYAPIHGMQLYYEIHGQGKPMVLLHGGITAFEGFGTNIDALAKSRQVIAVHLQGHGNTADIDRPYRFETLADDVAALVAYLKLGKIDLAGYSFGGGVALQTAIRHPEVVDHLVVISSVMAQTGFYPEGLAAFAQMSKNAPMLADSVNRTSAARGVF
jgi:pimeloyl-ACP methyl ester carboxylesterase